MTTARRLAAILAAGVVGYSRIMGGDEADTARALAIATSTVTIFNERFTSTPAVCGAIMRRCRCQRGWMQAQATRHPAV
jgi:hypothetical protein